jgi:hypothetical protein
MRFPIRSETDAFWLTIATAALAGVAVLIGVITTAVVGVIAFAAMALLALSAYLSSADRERRLPLREAALAPHPHGATAGVRHVLIVANEPLSGERLREAIGGAGGDRIEVDVLAPVLSSRTHLAYTDIDEGIRQARRRLERSLAWARSQGFLVRGSIGDASPTTAIEDELRDFGADEVIVVTAASRTQRWQERTELARLREELDVPVTQIVARPGGPGRAARATA